VNRNPHWLAKGATLQTIGQTNELIDHLTLESDFNSFHATMLDPDNSRRDVLTSYKTRKILEGVTYWFGVSIQSENILEECPEEIRFVFSSSSKDSDRPIQIVKSSVGNSIDHIISLNPDASVIGSTFIHFDFIVDSRPRRMASFSSDSLRRQNLLDLTPMALAAPTGPPALRSTVSTPIQLPVRGYPVAIPSLQSTIWVISSVRAGDLVEKAVICGFQ
jgi:hypothetical protein